MCSSIESKMKLFESTLLIAKTAYVSKNKNIPQRFNVLRFYIISFINPNKGGFQLLLERKGGGQNQPPTIYVIQEL